MERKILLPATLYTDLFILYLFILARYLKKTTKKQKKTTN